MCKEQFYQLPDCVWAGAVLVLGGLAGRVQLGEEAEQVPSAVQCGGKLTWTCSWTLNIKIKVMGAATSQSWFDLSLCPQDCSGNCLGLACWTSHSCGYQDKCQQPQHFQCPPLVCPVLAHKPPPNQTAAGWRMIRGWSELVPLPAQLHDEPRMCQVPHHLFMFCCAQTISEKPCLPKHHCWDTGL